MNGLAVLGAWTLVAAVIALLAGWSSAVALMNKHQGVAAWVQAVFSVVAILAAASISAYQLRSTREQQVRAQNEEMRALIEVLATLAKLLSLEVASRAAMLNNAMTESSRYQFCAGLPFRDIADVVNAIPVHQQREVAQVRLVFALRRLARLSIEIHETISRELQSSLGNFLLGRDPFSMVLEGLANLEANCDRRSEELAGRS